MLVPLGKGEMGQTEARRTKSQMPVRRGKRTEEDGPSRVDAFLFCG